MKYSKLFGAVISASLCISPIQIFSQKNNVSAIENTVSIDEEIDTADTSLVDSGIDYKEIVETINNPGVGYTTVQNITCKPGDTPVYNPTGNLMALYINIGAFSSGINGVADYDFDETFFKNLRATFENCRKNGCLIGLRFRYDPNGVDNPEPASFEKVLSHINQIKADGILEDFKDILAFVETGFVGKWGEQHGGKYVSLDYKAQLVDALLDCVPEEVSITVRTPNTFAKWAGIEMSEIDTYIAQEGSNASRIGIYNDGYMGSDSDLGTYSNREKETTWMSNQMLSTYFGGEFSSNLDWAKKFDTYLPENAIPEMYKTHLSYINGNIYSLYKDYTFNENYDIDGVDNSAYYGQTVFQFMRDHLGYRFVLRESKLNKEVLQGDMLNLSIDVENTGFANPIKKQKAEVILERDGIYRTAELDIDTTKWHSCTTTKSDISLKLPGDIEEGEWNIYLRLSVGNSGIEDSYMRSVQFANKDIWNSSFGANYLGTFNVKKSDDVEAVTDNTFYHANADNEVSVSQGDLFTSHKIVIDGKNAGTTEWNEELLAAVNGDNKLYISNDDKYLYIMAEIHQNAVAPVYNFRIENADNMKSYWIYYQPNGYVYFNGGGTAGASYDGCVCKRSGNIVEFKVPFGDVMGLAPNVNVSRVRVFVQESNISGWPSQGEVIAENYTISDTFDVYSVSRTIKLKENDTWTLNVESSQPSPSYQWYLNNIAIEGATSKNYTIENASSNDVGEYSVEITSETGTKVKTSICTVSDVYSLTSKDLNGDVNSDGEVNLSDAILLQKYLLCEVTSDYIDVKYSDLNKDNVINIFDLTILKNILLN